MRKPPLPEALLDSRRILVCVGAGGVGKTTIAAALALQAARRGRNALVITIDPARRLADALGVDGLENEPKAIPRKTLDGLQVPAEGGLSAMMLDVKRTLDDLVDRFAESEEVRQRILENRIYQHVSDALAGSAEYSAMEKVYALTESEQFDLIVVDTPPSQHALDFLEAPQRLLEFLDSRIVKLLLHPALSAGRLGFRVFQRSALRVLKLVEKVSGVGFLDEISEFVMAFEGMAEGFKQRAEHVRAMLLGSETSFILAAGPGLESTHHALSFLDRLEAYGTPLAGVVVNRARTWPGSEPIPERIPAAGQEQAALAALRDALAESQDADFPAEPAAAAAIAAAEAYAAVVRRHTADSAKLLDRAQQRGLFWRRVPELARDVHDLDALAHVADTLFVPREGGAIGSA